MEFVNKIKSALFSANTPDVAAGIKLCNQANRVLTGLLTKAENVGEKQQLITAIGQVKSFKAMFKALDITGSGYIPRKRTARDNVKWSNLPSAFQGRLQTGIITNLSHIDPTLFLEDASAIFCRRIQGQLKSTEAMKVNSVFCGEFVRYKNDEEIREMKYFNTPNKPIYKDTDLKTWFIDNIQQPILTKLEEFDEKESGWALSKIISLQANINKFTMQLGSSYIALPPQIQQKKACVNVQNDDDRCFAWGVVAALYPVEKNSNRPSKYPDPSTVLNLTGIQFPMTMKQIPRFEKQNNVSINVYRLQKGEKTFTTLPTYLSKAKQPKHVNLLIVQDVYYNEDNCEEEGPGPRYHYVWIKNLSRLLSSQLSSHKSRNYFCDRCLHYFYTEAARDNHYRDCIEMNECRIRLPSGDKTSIKFKNYKNKVKAPFIIYSDLESLLVPTDDKNKRQEHQPCSIAYYVKCTYDSTLSFFRSYRGKDCIEWFVRELEDFAENLETVFLCSLPMDPLTTDEWRTFAHATQCHICEKPFMEDDKKVRDHDHLTGKYRGAAHEGCNINFKDNHVVPVVFHGLSGYDSHFIIKNLATDLEGRVDLLPINKERYISFTKHLSEHSIKYRFIDSCRFMASKLDTLASYLTEHPELKANFPNETVEKLKLLQRKGVYPYDYFDSWEKFEEINLPPKSKFYNLLDDCDITDDDYTHAQNVWREFNIQNLGEYSDLYLKIDVLLLACIFEQFRSSCLKTYRLDPAHYYTLPGYTWDCMLKHTDISLELLTDIDIIMFVERGIRGGLSQCSTRYLKANNKYASDYDPAKPANYLLYVDINNQYGWAMSQHLPHGGFKWMTNIEEFDVGTIPDDSDTGFILEVDLHYPQELHDLHVDIPFCPEHRYPPASKQKKLLATLYDKERYVIHYRSLKQALAHGLKLTKIHRILQFNQSAWLKTYIDLNTKLRTAATNDFEKNLFKLMNNAVFGKTMENIRKHSIVKLVTKWEGRFGAEALIARPEFKNSVIFNENLVVIEMNKSEIYFNKPIYVGMSILDISKTKIYEFQYEYMKPLFGNKCIAGYTDTDSIIYSIEHPDVYEIIRRDCYERFDTSDYPRNNVYGIPQVNKKVLGLMKDEMNGKIMTEFVGLRSKMYAIRVDEQDAVKKAKGVKNNVIKTRITFDDYVQCLATSTEKSVEQRLITSKRHEVWSTTQPKIALSPHDNKRYLLQGSYNTLPFGHYCITHTT